MTRPGQGAGGNNRNCLLKDTLQPPSTGQTLFKYTNQPVIFNNILPLKTKPQTFINA